MEDLKKLVQIRLEIAEKRRILDEAIKTSLDGYLKVLQEKNPSLRRATKFSELSKEEADFVKLVKTRAIELTRKELNELEEKCKCK